MASIELRQLCKTYDNGFQAVRGIDLAIRDREFMVLVGPSGCGKTTSLRMIAGLEEATSGDLMIGDRRVNDVEPKDRDIAMVFQSYALYPHMTVRENMAFALRLRNLATAEIERRVTEASRMLTLDALLDRLPKQLSGGQRQRVALGRAVVRNPQAFLFDEPLSNLDAKLRGEMRSELRALHARLQATAVYVTHDQIEAMTLGDRITVMNQGRIQQVAEPMTVYDWPWNRFVAAFIGTPAMNFLPGRLVAGTDGPAFLLNTIELALAMPHRDRLASHSGSEAVLGLRPDHLILGPGPRGSRLPAVVHQVELMGDHQYITLELAVGGPRLTMKTDPHHRIRREEVIDVGIDTTRAHVFEAGGDDAANLTLPPTLTRQP